MLEKFFLKPFMRAEMNAGGRLEKITFPIDALNIFETYQYTTDLFPNYFGLGSDRNGPLAKIKAFVEFYERKEFFETGVENGFTTSNGIGAHTSKKLAKKAAVDELLERDAFLMHWYLRVSFLSVNETPAFLSVPIDSLASNNYKVIFRKTFLGLIETFVCFIVDKATGGFVIGLCSGKSNEDNIAKSFSEAIVNLFFGGNGRTQEQLIADFQIDGHGSLRGHRTYWLHLAPMPEWALVPGKAGHQALLSISPVELKSFYTKRGPIHICGQKLSGLLPLTVGFPSDSELEVLQKRSAIANEMTKLDLSMHPIP